MNAKEAILIVGPQGEFSARLSEILARAGYAVMEAPDPEAGMALLNQRPDIPLAIVSADDALERLVAVSASLKVLSLPDTPGGFSLDPHGISEQELLDIVKGVLDDSSDT